MIINTTSGLLKGSFESGLYLFKGIPYGYAKRFEAPVLSKWDGVLEATNFSKKAPQIEKGDIQLKNISEDCLTLNIYTPSLNQKLPVLVEIHGGAFQTGSNQSMNPWHVIGKDEFIYITINYRLGVLGYLYLDGYPTSGNNGTLDQLAALNWIKEHIENFGGDPSRITLLGSSAGAKAIGALMNHESSSDLLFSGASMIYEDGHKLAENKKYDFESNLIYADIDAARLVNLRMRNNNYALNASDDIYDIIEIDVHDSKKFNRFYKEYPFVPKDEADRKERCEEIFAIQAAGLARRLVQLNYPKCVLGISGGLDSTLAFLVVAEAYKMLGLDNKDIIGVTMPGFGTTGRTYNNACDFVKAYGATLKEVSIKDAAILHMKDIGLDENDRSVAYENLQARERTQILMDIANMMNGFVIGTGDLSELALGWCTYNGDHMSMYGVNGAIPKTLVRYLVDYVADISDDDKKKVLKDILDTPISPELLPPDKAGNILQQTESSIGPYVLHDFYLYHFLKYGASPKKIYFLAQETFKGKFDNETLKKWLKVFVKRFFTQQFKRNCVPDGIKVGTIGLSPRGDLRMPSDSTYNAWLKEVEELD